MAVDVERYLAAMSASLEDADATLELTLGGLTETTRVRLWRGQILVDWEPDDEAGDCLLRPTLVRRLLALGAVPDADASALRLRAGPRAVEKLSPRHADLGGRLGAPPGLTLNLQFDGGDGTYLGGTETYVAGRRGAALLALSVSVEQRALRRTSERTAPGSA